jgi:V/A-type H+/Na+-transporting ATPase subunit C
MSSSPYSAALGRITAHLADFLSKEAVRRLVGAKDIAELTKMLEGTVYGAEIVRAATTRQGAPMLEAAINATFAARNLHAYNSGSFAGRPVVGLYLERWDLENLSVILAAKARGRSVGADEERLVSWRERPAGVPAGVMTLDDLRALIAQPTIEASMDYLVRFGYGPAVLPLADAFARTGDIFPLVQALERDYYERLFARLRFFQGDEWVVREFLAVEVDHRNLLTLLKACDAGLPGEEAITRWIAGGTLASSGVPELLGAGGVAEVVAQLAPRFPVLPQGLTAYQADRTLAGFEAALRSERLARAIGRMRAYPVSLAILFAYLLLAESERADLRRVIYGTLYGLPREKVEPLLVAAGPG